MGASRKRRNFSREFKLEAVRLAQESGHPLNKVARELDINPRLLYRWTRDHRLAQENAISSPGPLTERDGQLAQLQRVKARLEWERGFLRRLSEYFAKIKR